MRCRDGRFEEEGGSHECKMQNAKCKIGRSSILHSAFCILHSRSAMTPQTEKLVRAVGFWGLAAMCINAVVGSGVFLLPTESYNLLGPFSLWAPLLFAIPVFILVLNFAEASSHFSEPGGRVSVRAHRVRRLRRIRDWLDELDRATDLTH